MTNSKALLAGAAILLLGACADGNLGAVGGAYVSPFYGPSLVSYEARDGRFPIVVRGNPFGGVPTAQLNSAVRQSARMPGWAPRARFVEDQSANADQGLRLVVVMNPAPGVGYREMCSPLSSIPVEGPGNRMTIRVAFCDGPQAMTDATLTTSPAPGESSASFIGALNNAIGMALPFIDRAQQTGA